MVVGRRTVSSFRKNVVLRRVYRRGDAVSRRIQGKCLAFLGAPCFLCPLCGYRGPFVASGGRYRRALASCPCCRGAERHRLTAYVLETRRASGEQPGVTLDFSPADSLTSVLMSHSCFYLSADVVPGRAVCLDLQALGLRSGVADLVVAIHVLEHVPDDEAALREIARVLRPGGVAIISVPIVADSTVEYGECCPSEHGHVRAPGMDWYERAGNVFEKVDVITSMDAPLEYQTFIYEDRRRFPDVDAPHRPPQSALVHIDALCVCRR